MTIKNSCFCFSQNINPPFYSAGHVLEFNLEAKRAESKLDSLSFKITIDIRINVFKESFFVRAAKQWNKLPFIIRRIACSNGFKASLMSHFWLKCDIADCAETID